MSQQPLQRGNRVGFIPVVHEVDGTRHAAWYRCLGGFVLEVYVDDRVGRTRVGGDDVDERVHALIEQMVRGDQRGSA